MTLHTTTVVLPPRRPRFFRRLAENFLYAFGLPILILLAYTLWVSSSRSPFFPTPWEVVEAFVSKWTGSILFTDVLPSLGRLGIAIVLCVLLGVAGGALIGRFRPLREFLEPMLEFFRAIPPPVLIPIVTLLMGITDQMKVAVIVAGAFWPVLLNTIEGVRATDAVMIETSRSFGLTRWQRIRFLVLPSAAPRIMTGIRQAMSIALIMMVISEMFNSSSGLGYQIVYFQRNFLIPEMWSGIVLLGLIGVLLSVIFGIAERIVLRWYHGLKEVERG